MCQIQCIIWVFFKNKNKVSYIRIERERAVNDVCLVVASEQNILPESDHLSCGLPVRRGVGGRLANMLL